MTLTPDVASGELIQSAWGNQIRDRTLQRFANFAALVAEWPDATDGAHAWLIDEASMVTRVGAIWKLAGPGGILAYGEVPPGADYTRTAAIQYIGTEVASLAFTLRSTRRVRYWGQVFGGIGVADGRIDLTVRTATAPVTAASPAVTISRFNAPSAGAAGLMTATKVVSLAAGTYYFGLYGFATATWTVYRSYDNPQLYVEDLGAA
jgi:hypothetical protein